MHFFDESQRQWPAPYFDLPDGQGRRISRSYCRERANLALFFLPDLAEEAQCSAAKQLAGRRHELAEQETEVLLLTAETAQGLQQLESVQALPFPVLADADMRVRAAYGRLLPAAPPAAPILVALDRYGAPFVAFVGAEVFSPDLGDRLLGQLMTLQLECPE